MKVTRIAKIDNNINLKTRKSINVLSNNFVNKLFSVYQLKNYIFAFVRFIYDKNNKVEEPKTEDNLSTFENFVNNNLTNIYNNYYLNNTNNVFLNNINNLYSLKNIDYYVNKFTDINYESFLKTNRLKNNYYIFQNRSKLVLNYFDNIINQIEKIEYTGENDIRTRQKEIQIEIEKLREEETRLERSRVKKIEYTGENDIKTKQKEIQIEIERLREEETRLERSRIKKIEHTGENNIISVKNLENKFKINKIKKFYSVLEINKVGKINKINKININNEVNTGERDVIKNFLIRALKNIIINQVLESRYFSDVQKNIAKTVIEDLKIQESFLKNIYIDNKDYSSENSESFERFVYLKQFYYSLSENIKTSLKNKNVFSNFQLRQIDVVLDNKKNIDIINSLSNLYFYEFSDYVYQKNIKLFFENISNKVLTKLSKNNLFNNINKNILVSDVNGLFQDIYNKYSDYNNTKNQNYYNNFKINLLNKIENICSQEMYDNFVDMYLEDKEKRLIDKININRDVRQIINNELSVYRDSQINLQKNLNNIMRNIVYNSLNQINNRFYNIELNKNINEVIFKSVVNKINKDKNIVEIINQENKRQHNQKVLKTNLYNFINNNIKLYKQGKKDVSYIDKIIKIIDDEATYLRDDFYKQDFIENKIKDINNINNGVKYFINKKNQKIYLVYKNDELNKIDRVKSFVSNYIDKVNGIYVSKITRPREPYKKNDFILINNFKYAEVESKYLRNKYLDKNILRSTLTENILKVDLKSFNLYKDNVEPIVISVPKRIYDIVVNGSEIKIRNPFEGFEYLKMVHKKPGLKPETSSFSDSDIFNKKSKTFEINNTVKNINKTLNKDVNRYERVDVLNKKIIKSYDKVIEQAIDDKMNKNISDITDQVYNKIEKRLKSEQRRLGIS